MAGLYASVYASKFGKVALLTKSAFEESNSFWAQGGIAAAVSEDDSPQFHLEDTLVAGRDICDVKAVDILVNDGVDRINDLISWGMKFDSHDGKLALGLEGGHSKRRVLHAGGDATGKEVVKFLIRKVKNIPEITVYEFTQVCELISDGNDIKGVQTLNTKTSEQTAFYCNRVFLASGGASGIYQRTTNPLISTGDGVSLAYNAGAKISGMEFIQFHPTSLYTGTDKTYLISEAVRGEGAHLINFEGKRFMKSYHELAELAPRDVVSKAIYNEMKLAGEDFIYLSLLHLDADKIKKRFSNIYKEALEFGIDITAEPVPVAPAAHYTIGGVKTGYNGETNINGLYACGEVASTGVHGANRLASNSLLECMVFSKRAVDHALDTIVEHEETGVGTVSYTDVNKEFYLEKKNRIARIMTKKAGIIRQEELLTAAFAELQKLKTELSDREKDFYLCRVFSLVNTCSLIVNAALKRNESRGGHIRSDFPEESEAFRGHFVQRINTPTEFIPLTGVLND